jgi:hypothetical protein
MHIGHDKDPDRYSPDLPCYQPLPLLTYESLEQYGLIPLPNLKSFYGDNYIDSITFHRVCGPRVSHIEFSFDTSEDMKPDYFHLAGVLERIPLPTSLRELKISGDVLVDISLLYPSLLQLPMLEVLHCSVAQAMPIDILQVMLSSHNLRQFDYAQSSDFLRAIRKGVDPTFRLEHLGLQTYQLRECIEVIQSIDTSRLESIEILYGPQENEFGRIQLEPAPPSEVQALFRSLQSSSACSVLDTIYYDASNGQSTSGAGCITMETIEPLLSCPNLVAITIISDTIFAFDNESIKKFVAAWPRMVHFDFDARKTGWNPHSITLDGLVPIASGWPELYYLNITFSGWTKYGYSLGELIDEDIAKGPGCLKLDVLAVGNSPMMSDLHIVAAFLHELFPNLRGISVPDWSGSVEDWESVGMLLKYFGKLREKGPALVKDRI